MRKGDLETLRINVHAVQLDPGRANVGGAAIRAGGVSMIVVGRNVSEGGDRKGDFGGF